jgi:hypothetical protein
MGAELPAERQNQEQQNPGAAKGQAHDGRPLIAVDHQADDAQQDTQRRPEDNSQPAKGGNRRASARFEKGDQHERRQRNSDDAPADAPDAALLRGHDGGNGALQAGLRCSVHRPEGSEFYIDRSAAHVERLQVEVDSDGRLFALQVFWYSP